MLDFNEKAICDMVLSLYWRASMCSRLRSKSYSLLHNFSMLSGLNFCHSHCVELLDHCIDHECTQEEMYSYCAEMLGKEETEEEEFDEAKFELFHNQNF